ncbi:MAG: hypothetical protein ABIJ23_02925 [Candidatus Magasanikbacteria bacterium]
MSKNKISFIASFLVLFGILGFISFVSAQSGPYIGLDYGQYTGLGNQDIRFTTATIIRAALGLLGTVSLVIILYAGFKWMTAGGNEESVKDAQKILTAAVIGLVIILSAYSITRFITSRLLIATHQDVLTEGDVF